MFPVNSHVLYNESRAPTGTRSRRKSSCRISTAGDSHPSEISREISLRLADGLSRRKSRRRAATRIARRRSSKKAKTPRSTPRRCLIYRRGSSGRLIRLFRYHASLLSLSRALRDIQLRRNPYPYLRAIDRTQSCGIIGYYVSL